MDYSLWLEYQTRLNLNVDPDDDADSMREEIYADIKYHCFDEGADFLSSNEKVVGYMDLLYYNYSFAVNNGLDMRDAFSSINYQEIGETIFDFEEGDIKESIIDEAGEAMSHNFLVVHDFGIYPEFRNKGLGETALKGLIKQFQGRCGYIILKSLPKQLEAEGVLGENLERKKRMQLHLLEKSDRKAQARLNSFYKRCGFQELKKPRHFFILNLD